MHLDQRRYLERSLATENSKRSQTPADHEEWSAAGYVCRVLCHYDKIFAVWRETDTGPEIMGRIRVIDIEATTRYGLAVCLESSVRGLGEDLLWVGHEPDRIFGLPVFCHVPYISDVTFTPESRVPEHYVTRFPLVIKMRSSPFNPVNGDVYVTQIGEFRSRYPKFADLKL